MLEPLFCPCCTPALMHALAQTNLASLPQPMLWLGTGAIAQRIMGPAPASHPGRDEPPRLATEL